MEPRQAEFTSQGQYSCQAIDAAAGTARKRDRKPQRWCEEGESLGLSKKGASYKPAPTPDLRCDRCKYMFHRLP